MDLEELVNVFLEKGVQKIFISMGEKGILYAIGAAEKDRNAKKFYWTPIIDNLKLKW